MKDALLRLFEEESECCLFFEIIISRDAVIDNEEHVQERFEAKQVDEIPQLTNNLNDSQNAAVLSCDAPLSLIWGPPGQCFFESLAFIHCQRHPQARGKLP